VFTGIYICAISEFLRVGLLGNVEVCICRGDENNSDSSNVERWGDT